jgi:hypothetical protein
MCIHIAAKRSFADIIEATDNHQASIEHISQEAKVHPIWTRAILQVLTKAHIFVETEQHLFKNTPLSDCLRRDYPRTVKWQASALLCSRSLILLSQLDYYINKVGSSLHQELGGGELYELFEQQEEDQSGRLSPEGVIIELGPRAEFDMMLESSSVTANTAIAQAHQFKGSVCDLGGGQGSLLATIARHHPGVKGILFERQSTIENLRGKQSEYPFYLVSGDFFQQIPYADIYILKQVFHNWPDNSCSDILKKCAEANPDAQVLVIERVIRDSDNITEIANLAMMIELNGKERTIEEYRAIGNNAGFKRLQVYPTQSRSTIIEMTMGTL